MIYAQFGQGDSIPGAKFIDESEWQISVYMHKAFRDKLLDRHVLRHHELTQESPFMTDVYRYLVH